MIPVLEALQYWHWFILAVLLMIAETVFPGSFLIWFGVGAAASGVLLLAAPALSWQVQFVAFALVSAASIVGWRRFKERHPETTSHPTLNKRGQSYIGRRFTLAEPIIDGVGKLKVDDGTWKIEGSDLPAGTPVTVVGIEGTILRVERAA